MIFITALVITMNCGSSRVCLAKQGSVFLLKVERRITLRQLFPRAPEVRSEGRCSAIPRINAKSEAGGVVVTSSRTSLTLLWSVDFVRVELFMAYFRFETQRLR